jgi:hypothetical protein
MAKQRTIGKPSTMGMSKHRKCSHGGPPTGCFTGKRGSSSRKNRKLTMKEKSAKKNTHINKYAEFSKSESVKKASMYRRKK